MNTDTTQPVYHTRWTIGWGFLDGNCRLGNCTYATSYKYPWEVAAWEMYLTALKTSPNFSRENTSREFFQNHIR